MQRRITLFALAIAFALVASPGSAIADPAGFGILIDPDGTWKLVNGTDSVVGLAGYQIESTDGKLLPANYTSFGEWAMANLPDSLAIYGPSVLGAAVLAETESLISEGILQGAINIPAHGNNGSVFTLGKIYDGTFEDIRNAICEDRLTASYGVAGSPLPTVIDLKEAVICIPEPSSCVLALLGLASLGVVARRRRI